MPKNTWSFEHKSSHATLWRRDALKVLEDLDPASVSLMFTSPPYCIGKEYESARTLDEFVSEFERTIDAIVRAIKPGGAVCWQIGNHVHDGEFTPLDSVIIGLLRQSELKLRNRIIWTFGHGTHAKQRFSGRHETILWFSKGDPAIFNLDAVRVPQSYPGKRHYKGPQKGQFSGHPDGKNPGDVWDIPNVKSRHLEKTSHPCQFPVALAQRMIRALTHPGDLILDPYLGSGTTAVAALTEARSFVGCDVESNYVKIARGRLTALVQGSLPVRPDVPPRKPVPGEAVARKPDHFWRGIQESLNA